MRHLEAACQRWGLVISGSKTECMVLDPRLQLSPEWWRSSIRCQRCHKLTPEDSMLVCSCCSSGWHTACLEPPLATVPEDDWLCTACTAAAAASGASTTISSNAPVRITVAGQPVAWVQQFKYLGSQFSNSGSLDAEVTYRIQQAASAFRRLHNSVWRHSCIQLGTKMRIYRAMVSSVLLYGGHSWALTAPQLDRLEKLQRRQLRQVLGTRAYKAARDDSGLRMKISNEELMAKCCKQRTIAEQLERQRGRWVGHVLRMPDHRLAKQLFFGTLISSTPAQSRAPRPLLDLYKADVDARYPRTELRKLERCDLLLAAANKNDWNHHFP
jgi:hypothetical protein